MANEGEPAPAPDAPAPDGPATDPATTPAAPAPEGTPIPPGPDRIVKRGAPPIDFAALKRDLKGLGKRGKRGGG